jgi:hypothetical protein
MADDDFLIPRRSRSSASDSKTGPRPEEATQGMRIDPKVLEERRRRKEAAGPHPKTVDAETDEPWRYMDRRIGDAFSTFEEPRWTLGDTARWVAERTREAVNGLSIDEERLPDITNEIQEALAAGQVRSFAHTPNDPVPRELPSETWAVYQLVIEARNGLLWIVPFRCSGSPNDDPALLDMRLSREDVLRRWPDDKATTPSRVLGTVGTENACRLWLTELMKTNPNNPQPKETVRQTAEKRFPKLGKRAFDRAWAAAISHAAADKWSAPGRRS